MNSSPQAGILADLPSHARYLTFELSDSATPHEVLAQLAQLPITASCVIGVGLAVVERMNQQIPGLRAFPRMDGPNVVMPSSKGALWCWIRGEDRGELLHQGRAIIKQLRGTFNLADVTDAFRYSHGLDITGYEDGTENPEGDDAVKVAMVDDVQDGIGGSSFVAVQKWQHDLDGFEAMPTNEQDHAIGRRRSDNEELDDAPESAHVKRTAQEAFDPEAFVVRRSMPWTSGQTEGLMFVSFSASFDPFEALARNMLGLNDGIVDALFGFTQPLTGDYYWCPPQHDGHLDLRGLQE
jgi:putative iron-dependent peroxidase